jgi:hypothetical protein
MPPHDMTSALPAWWPPEWGALPVAADAGEAEVIGEVDARGVVADGGVVRVPVVLMDGQKGSQAMSKLMQITLGDGTTAVVDSAHGSIPRSEANTSSQAPPARDGRCR